MDRSENLSYALPALKQARTDDDLTRIIYELRDRYELLHLAYHAPKAGRSAEGQDILYATGSTEFCNRYVERGYIETDPAVLAARQSGTPVDWDTVDHRSTASKRHFNELESFAIGRRGMTIPCFNAEGEMGIFSFSANHVDDAEWIAFRDERAPDLAYIGMHFHAVAMRIARGKPRMLDRLRLPRQGKRILSLFAQGHTPATIAHMTGTSIHTVRMHLDRMQERLGCKTKAEVVTKALELGLITKKSRLLGVALVVKFSTGMEILDFLSDFLT